MDKHSLQIQNYFNEIADNYDRVNKIISFGQHQKWQICAARDMKIKPDDKILDLCCGTCEWTLQLAKYLHNGKIIGIDFSPNMLRKGKCKTRTVETISLLQGDVMQLPFSESHFDFVTIAFGLRNVPDYRRVLQEMYRVLKPNGTAVCLETSQPESYMFRQLFRLYFRLAMPVLGKVLTRNYDAYAWLGSSTLTFPEKIELAGIFRDLGFRDISVKSMSFGTAAIHTGKK